MEESEPEDTSSEDLQLKIAESPKKKRKRKGKQKIPLESEMQRLDETIENTIAKCKNLTSEVARKMLCKLVKNDHVLALSLLKAEEEVLREQEEMHSNVSSSENEDDKKSENDLVLTPKLTRSKAKQLNQQLPIPGSLSSPQPDEEVIKLINEDLRSDDEDEEYQPEDSDGDITNTTFSDIDSQPSTPGSALVNNDDSPSKNSEFKVPKAPLSAAEQENIARRTRSKLCLQKTPIETIESTFVPPDIDLDMYDFEMYENEDDNEWKEFLNEFMMPLPKNPEEMIDDDNADPEYIAEQVPEDDKEEKKLGRVSKKELNQLISELIEDSCNATFDSIDAFLPKKNEPPSTSKSSRKHSKFTPSKKLSTPKSKPNELNTPPHAVEIENKTIETPDQASKIQYYYSPSNLQTPQRTGFITPTTYQSPNTSFTSAIPYNYAPQAPVQSTPIAAAVIQPQPSASFVEYSPVKTLPSILVVNQNQLEVRPLSDATGSFNSNSIMSQGFYYNGLYTLPQFQSVVMQVPTVDLLQNGFNFSASLNSSMDLSQTEMKENVDENMTDDLKNQLKRESRLKIFDYLNNEEPQTITKEDGSLKGFTSEQYTIFVQQFCMHAQLLSQHYVQTYAHPTWWSSAEPLKKNLFELKEASPKNISTHIKNCLKLCKDWEAELEENNERNKKYIQFLHDEIDLDVKSYQEKKHFKGMFHNRMMEVVMRSKAIMFPSLLPKTPFRAVKFTKVDPVPSELLMIALGIEHAYDKIYKELNCLNPRRLREPKVMSIVATIIRTFGSFRSENGLLKLIEKYKQHALMNPIKYYFKHKKAPAVTHKIIENVNYEEVKPPVLLRRGLLPKAWDTYKFSEERLKVFPFDYGEKINNDVINSSLENIDKTNSVEQQKIPKEGTENLSSQQKLDLNDSIQLEIIYDSKPKINVIITPSEIPIEQPEAKKEKKPIENIPKRNPSLKNWQKTNEEKQRNLTSILKKVTSNIEKSPVKKKSVNFLLPLDQPEANKSQKFSDKIKASYSARKKFQLIIESFFSKFTVESFNTKNHDVHPLIRKLFIRTRSFDIYWQIVSCNIMLSKKNTSNNKQQDGSQNNNNNNANGGTTTSACDSNTSSKTKKQISSEEYSKKINRKLTDNRALIMQNAKNSADIVEKDCSYALNYLQRVRKTLLENGDDVLYSQFMKMLTTFNPEIESVPELYYKMEHILMPNYSDLLDLFLTFLLPEHATEIGKFCEHFMLTNMTDLVEKLNFFFQKQPHLKKIYACINELSNEQDLTLERLKSKILPLLKGNQVLIDWFMELFDRPSENSVSSLDEYETLYMKKSLNDSDNFDDGYEEMQSQDLIDCENGNFPSCGVKYINGKIMYRCKTLLPAKISFLANDNVSCDEKNNHHEDSSPSLCVHEIRKHIQFNDSKKPADEQNDEKAAKKKKIGRKKFKVCDAQTLKAHAIRLNAIHAQNGEKLADVMNQLETTGSSESPKKQIYKATKKPSSTSPKKILKSPSSSSSDVSMNFSSPSPSKTLQISRKLKTLINENSEDEQHLKKQKLMDSSSDSDRLNVLCSNEFMDEDTAPKTIEENGKKLSESEAVAWTREEDKLILEEIKNGFSDKCELFRNLSVKLDNREKEEIQKRFEFLLNFVTNLTSSKVS